MLDLILERGIVIDGTGSPGRQQDVGICGELIAEIGDLSDAEAGERLDVTDKVVAPGFIDLHTHHNNEMDGGIENIPDADNYLRQGVTTCVGGNCGGTAFPIGPHLDRVAELEIRNNYAALVGCNTSRSAVLTEERPATETEIEAMKALVRGGFEEGAIGLSSGVRYLPFVTTKELTEMSKVAAEFGSFYVSHIRNEGEDLLESIAELVEVARGSGAPAQISHIKCYGKANWGNSQRALELIEAARDQGLDVSADQYPYTGCFTGLGGTLFGQENCIRAGRQGGFRELLKGELRRQAETVFAQTCSALDDGDGIILAPLAPHPEFQGKTLAEYLTGKGGDPFEQSVELCASGGSISAIYMAMCEEDVVTYMRNPNVMVGSDGHLRILGKSFSHPRNFGTFPRVLARYVRGEKVLSLEEAIHKMTGMPARRLGFKRRGRIAQNSIADITVFDPEQIQDHATFREGNAYATGIALVLLAGHVALKEDRPAEKGYGRVIRRGEG